MHEYILREKIKRSCFLLKQNVSLTVETVSKIFDFCSCDYFIKIFKRYVGLTPMQYRKMDNGFYGLCDKRRRKATERRSIVKDRRSAPRYGKVIILSNNSKPQYNLYEDFYNKFKDRRRGLDDRRQIF